MIGSFPDPYPDELLYSVCARFQARMQYPNKKSALQELFGSTTKTVAVDLPSNLANMVSALAHGNCYTVERIIDNYTLMPFFGPFLPHGRTAQLREDMRGDGGHKIHKRSGVMASRIPAPSRLRFCPLCIEEDRKNLGEAYWHRLHQTSGVEVCPVHNVFLENICSHHGTGKYSSQLPAAEEAIRALSPRHLDLFDHEQRILLKIAHDAAWLLEHPRLGVGLESLYKRYIKLLLSRGLATYTSSIHVCKLLDEFRGYYSPTLLKLLHCDFTGHDQIKTNWLLRLVRPPKHAQHPLYHLLLMQFLERTAKEFFQLSGELRAYPKT